MDFLHQLSAAQGYVELGMHLDANDELEQISPEYRASPPALAIRLQIYRALKKWELMQIVAVQLVKADPNEVQWAISLAYATRRAESIPAAKCILENAVENHAKEPLLHYNLACYECQLGNMEQAKQRLTKAFNLDPNCRLMALEDEDLEPLWSSL